MEGEGWEDGTLLGYWRGSETKSKIRMPVAVTMATIGVKRRHCMSRVGLRRVP